MSRRRRYARQGASRILTTPRGFGSGGVVVAPAITLTLVASALSVTDITVTGVTSGDISTGVYGVEYSVNAVPGSYPFSLNTVGVAANQSITINLASEGIAAGDVVYIRAYYNTDPLDDLSTRVYGTPTLIVTVAFPVGLEGSAFFMLMEDASYALMESGASVDISAFTSASALGGTEIMAGVQGGNSRGVTATQIKTYVNT